MNDMHKKKGAMELSISTIVIIVLAMSMLIFGMILLKNIFGGAIEVVDMTDTQVKNQIKKLFGEDEKLVVYPDSRRIDARQGEVADFGIGIQNLLKGTQANDATFSYEVSVADDDLQKKCGINENEVHSWISTGRTQGRIGIAPGDFYDGRVSIEVPEGSNFCTFRLSVDVKHGPSFYGSELMDVTIKP